MNKKIHALIVGILLLGIVTAGIVSYVSNTIEGTISVSEPVFYGYTGKILLINDKSSSTASYKINGSIEGDTEIFETDSFDDEINFYGANYDLYVRAKVINGAESGTLTLSFGYIDSSDNYNEICNSNVLVDSIEDSGGDFKQYSNSCSGLSVTGVKAFYYEIIPESGKEFRISLTNQETKIQLNKL